MANDHVYTCYNILDKYTHHTGNNNVQKKYKQLYKTQWNLPYKMKF